MKKSLIALAVLAASGAAMAQSSVTLFGVADVGVGHVSGDNSVTGVTQSGNLSSRLGFRGVEDLGGGLKAGFWLEGALSPDAGTGNGAGVSNGGLAFTRRSTVSVMGNFGEVRLGRELAGEYVATSSYDPFNQVGLAAFQGWMVTGTDIIRRSNGVSYSTPTMGGFSAMAHYAFGETAGSTKKGSYFGLNAGYANGPLSATVSAGQMNAVGTEGKYKAFSLGASYNLGVVKPAFIYHKEEKGLTKYNTYMLAATAPVGKGNVVASYQRLDLRNSSADTDIFAVGYVYDLSKRTAVYGTYAYANNKNGAARTLNGIGASMSGSTVGVTPGSNVDGYQVGVRHAF